MDMGEVSQSWITALAGFSGRDSESQRHGNLR